MGVSEIVQWLREVGVSERACLRSDSRDILPGDLFFAYAPMGHRYIDDAIRRGAVGVVLESKQEDAQEDAPRVIPVPHIHVADLKQHAGRVANAYYHHPDQAMKVVAVTGTNGKTSCTQWIAQTLARLGQKSAVMGTLGVSLFASDEQGESGQSHTTTFETGYTTPEAVRLQTCLTTLRDAGVEALALEASSIGLVEERLQGLHMDVAVFTNLTRDHLDYHGDMATYEAAKARLFTWEGLRAAVINLDDPMGVRLRERVENHPNHPQIITYSTTAATSTLRASAIRPTANGTTFHVEFTPCTTDQLPLPPAGEGWGEGVCKTRLIGDFNVSNALAVLGTLLALEVPWQDAVSALEQLRAVPGRMEQYGGQEAPLVVIDYAHTPDALEKTLHALRPIATARGGALWCVFGCGGNRDRGKRAQMGAVAQWADHLVVTSDNPRFESPQAIIEDILQGITAPEKQAKTHRQEDRASAILRAIKWAQKADVVLIAGKGHETYQDIQGKRFPFLDADHARVALGARVAI